MNPTLSWERVGKRFYRTFEGPPLKWGLKTSQKHIRAAPHGGVISTWDREDIIVRRHANAEASRHRPKLGFHDARGNLLGSAALDFGSVVDVLAPAEETTIIVSGTGLCRHYTDFGQNFVQVHLPGTPVKASLCTDGYVVQLDIEEGLSFAFVTQYTSAEPKVRAVSTDTAASFDSWCIVPLSDVLGQPETILFTTATGDVYQYDLELRPHSPKPVASNVPVGYLVVSVDGRYICFSNGKGVKVLTSDFSQVILHKQCVEHTSLYWVASQALALRTGPGEIVIVNLDEETDSATIYFDEDEVALISEVDGLRALGDDSQTLLLPVSRNTAETFRLGSTAPSAILLSCIDYLDAASPRADQNVKLLGAQELTKAVDTCISAALAELDPKYQKKLLRAASFGKSVLKVYDSTRYVDAINSLHVGNSLRGLSEHPLFATNAQLSSLGYTQLIQRLELRQLWPTATAIARLRGMPVEPIYIEWACWHIQNHDEKEDDELLDDLARRLSKLGAYSHSKMARRALEQGRQKVALRLLEQEPVAAERVSIMIEMEMIQPALEQAVRSGSPFLLDYVLLVLAEQLTFSQLMSNIGWNAPLVERYTQLLMLPPNSKESLHQFLIQVDKRPESLELEFEDVVRAESLGTQLQGLHALEKKYSNTNRKFQSESRACAEWAELLEKQKGFEATFKETATFTNLSAAETIRTLLKISQEKTAEQMRAKLGISERQFCWLRLDVLCERRDWHGLWDLSQKRPIIGYRPFFDAAFEAGNLEAAARYVPLISDASVEEKVGLLLKCKRREEAQDLATKSRDQRAIALVQQSS